MPLAVFQDSSLKPMGLTSMMLWGLTCDSTQIYKLITMQTLRQVEYKNVLLIFTNNLLDVQRMKWRGCVFVWLRVCESMYLMGTSWNFDVIDKRSCSPNPNGTIPYDPLCTDLQKIKETEFCPRQ